MFSYLGSSYIERTGRIEAYGNFFDYLLFFRMMILNRIK